MDGNDIFASAAKAKAKTEKTVKTNKNTLVWVASAVICVLFPILSSWVEMDSRNPFTGGNALLMLFSVVCNYTMFLVSRQPSYEAELKQSSVYATAHKEWQDCIDKIRKGHLMAFGEYCRRRTVEEPQERIRDILESAIIKQEDFDRYKMMRRKDLHALVGQEDGISKHQYKAILRAMKTARYNPIDPSLILCLSNEVSASAVGRKKMTRSKAELICRPLILIGVSIAASSVAFFPIITDPGIPAIMAACSRVITVVTATVAGYSSGTNKAREEAADLSARAEFMREFLEAETEPEEDEQS